MKWTKYTITTHIDAVDILSYELDAIGIEGIEIVDHQGLSQSDKEKMFVDIAPEPEVIDDVALVSFYMEEKDSESDIREKVSEIIKEISTYTNVGEGTILVSETEDKDWINNWKQYAKPFRASRRIAICPTWIDEIPDELLASDYNRRLSKDEDKKDEEKNFTPKILRIDPGVAFGTGSHETTKLCIQALDRLLEKNDRVFDIGCGSGILSIAAILLGASYATAMDIDEIAVEAARENFHTNNIPDASYKLMAGNLLADGALADEVTSGRHAGSGASEGFSGYDVVVANILPDVIVPLADIVPRLLKKGGIYITSGILSSKESSVRQAMVKNGFTDIEVTPMGEWVGMTARR